MDNSVDSILNGKREKIPLKKSAVETIPMIEYELPSGQMVEFRKMKLKDEDVLTNVELVRNGNATDVLLSNVTGQTVSTLEGFWLGDRVDLLIEIRTVSKGKYFYPNVTCPNCGNRYEQEINLRKLERKKLERKLFKNDNLEFDLLLPVCKKKIISRILTGKEEKEIRKIRTEHSDMIMSYLMMIRTVSVEGMNHKNVNWFANLDTEDTDYFKDEYDKREFGVLTKTISMCKKCMSEFDLEVPFDQTFFLHSGRKKN